jgi:hypothetical protein
MDLRFCSILTKILRKGRMEQLVSVVSVGIIFRQAVTRGVCLARLVESVILAHMNEAVSQVVHIENFVGCSQNAAAVKHSEDYCHFCDCGASAAGRNGATR